MQFKGLLAGAMVLSVIAGLGVALRTGSAWLGLAMVLTGTVLAPALYVLVAGLPGKRELRRLIRSLFGRRR